LSAGGSQQRATQQHGIVGQKTERESSGITPWRRNDRIDEEVTRGQTELTRSSTRTERGRKRSHRPTTEEGEKGIARGTREPSAAVVRHTRRRGGASRPTRLARTNRGVLGAKVGSTWSRQGIHVVLLLVLVERRGCFARGILRTPPVGGFFTFSRLDAAPAQSEKAVLLWNRKAGAAAVPARVQRAGAAATAAAERVRGRGTQLLLQHLPRAAVR
jgi:hypothetical protein